MLLTAKDISGIPERPRIAVGARNRPKLEAARQAFYSIWPEAEILATPAHSGVREQLWSAGEALQGALNRARTALDTTCSDVGVGLEGEVEQGPGDLLFLSGWGVIVTADGRLGVGGGARTPLPPALAVMLRAGVELAPAVDTWLSRTGTRHQEGAVGVLTGGHLTRASSFANILLHAIAAIWHPSWYPNLEFTFTSG